LIAFVSVVTMWRKAIGAGQRAIRWLIISGTFPDKVRAVDLATGADTGLHQHPVRRLGGRQRRPDRGLSGGTTPDRAR
jgi:hypothetical protein